SAAVQCSLVIVTSMCSTVFIVRVPAVLPAPNGVHHCTRRAYRQVCPDTSGVTLSLATDHSLRPGQIPETSSFGSAQRPSGPSETSAAFPHRTSFFPLIDDHATVDPVRSVGSALSVEAREWELPLSGSPMGQQVLHRPQNVFLHASVGAVQGSLFGCGLANGHQRLLDHLAGASQPPGPHLLGDVRPSDRPMPIHAVHAHRQPAITTW